MYKNFFFVDKKGKQTYQSYPFPVGHITLFYFRLTLGNG